MRLRREDAENKRMGRRGIRWILAAVFCAGLLLTGIGLGVGLVEASRFEYTGEVSVGGEERAAKTVTVDLDRGQQGKNKLYLHPRLLAGEIAYKLETSKDIPKNKIQFVVEYNPNNVSDVIVDKEYDYGFYEEGKADQADTYTMYYVDGMEPANRNELTVFFEYKDEILKNLKEKKIANYVYPTMYSVTVRIHPSNRELIAFY